MVRHEKEHQIEISFLFQNIPEPDFAPAVLQSHGDDPSQWIDFPTAAASLGMPVNSLFRITSSINILYREIGLGIRFGNRNIETWGYTRKRGKWEMSTKCVEEIALYKAQFPQLFTLLDQVDDHLQAFHLFPGADRGTMETNLDEMVKFIGTLPCSLAKRITVGSAIASTEAVKKLQKVSSSPLFSLFSSLTLFLHRKLLITSVQSTRRANNQVANWWSIRTTSGVHVVITSIWISPAPPSNSVTG